MHRRFNDNFSLCATIWSHYTRKYTAHNQAQTVQSELPPICNLLVALHTQEHTQQSTSGPTIINCSLCAISWSHSSMGPWVNTIIGLSADYLEISFHSRALFPRGHTLEEHSDYKYMCNQTLFQSSCLKQGTVLVLFSSKLLLYFEIL